MQGEFEVTSVDLLPTENASEHLTTRYAWQSDSQLVVRRGWPIRLRMRVQGAFDERLHGLMLRLETHPRIDFASRVRDVLVYAEGAQQRNQFGLRAEMTRKTASNSVSNSDSDSLEVTLTLPPTMPVCEWFVHVFHGVWTRHGRLSREEEAVATKERSLALFVICNPYLPEDDTYLAQRKAVDDYLNETEEIVFTGVSGRRHMSFSKTHWQHSQFDFNTMRTVMYLLTMMNLQKLRGATGLTLDERGNVPRVGRKLSYAVNAFFLLGDWKSVEEAPADGHHANYWRNTAELVQEFIDSHQSIVRYGQCWVFASVFASFLRTIGIPCRSVTCLGAAHDTDKSLTVDTEIYLDERGRKESERELDSVWNFHVWTEMWCRRADLEEGYDGWQVVDATPQEASEGVTQCGPMPVKAIHEGRLDLPYDGWFTYGEVNADEVTWFYRLVRGSYELVDYKFRKDTVGRMLMTYDPHNPSYPDFVTRAYKPKEGTQEERNLHIKALKSAGAAVRHARIRDLYANELASFQKEVELELADLQQVLYGDDIRVHATVNNKAADVRTVRLSVRVESQTHTGVHQATIDDFSDEVRLKTGESVTLEFVVPFRNYARLVIERPPLAVQVHARVLETDQLAFEEDKFMVEGNCLRIETKDRVPVGQEVRVSVVFQNPLKELLHDTELIFDGGAFTRPMRVKRFPREIDDIPVRTNGRFRVLSPGRRTLTVTVRSRELGDIRASHSVTGI